GRGAFEHVPTSRSSRCFSHTVFGDLSRYAGAEKRAARILPARAIESTMQVSADESDYRALRDARVLVTGATGFIGRHLCHSLREQGAQLVLLQRQAHASPWPDARTVVLDPSDRAGIANALCEIKPDLVFHLAGFVSGERSGEAMARAFDGNVLFSANILLSCLAHLPDTRVIFTSSLEASNPRLQPAETGSPYGVSKLMVEVLSGTLNELYAAPMFSARLGMVYGPSDPNCDRLVPTVIRALLKREAPHLSSGKRRSDWVYIDDVITGLLAMASTQELPHPALVLASGELHSVREVAELLASIIGATVPIHYDPSRDRPCEQERVADMMTTRAALGLVGPAIDLRSGLTRTVDAYRALTRSSRANPAQP
ncbi:MAG TPA: NAD-dependent epimerase/dehydratase family protein, partial [Polyangiales bacterium]|nr:NAD-dependent epimerase/dehydratase family protein [Polyangiales bacterium]